jgi:hypothetical protein
MGRILIHHVREHSCVYQEAPFCHRSDHFGVSCSSLGMDSGIPTVRSSRTNDPFSLFYSITPSRRSVPQSSRPYVCGVNVSLNVKDHFQHSAWMLCCPYAHDVLQGLSG